ncbi:contractile injection system tape measure protein [uncultured Roseobacter sp.]|uniref:contractile injection system tape measure protein n=1 Tax=uncultured Roseobacter sp. TaxID=114847 RepID=UPI0026073097|nr:contractile injection system tape measure protein [uncultured Roseobacter sp.]
MAAPAPIASAPPASPRVDTVEADFEVTAPRGPLSSPEQLLDAVRREILPALSDLLESPSWRDIDIQVPQIEIDLGDWPDDPVWSEVRWFLARRLETALAPWVTQARLQDAAAVGAGTGDPQRAFARVPPGRMAGGTAAANDAGPAATPQGQTDTGVGIGEEAAGRTIPGSGAGQALTDPGHQAGQPPHITTAAPLSDNEQATITGFSQWLNAQSPGTDSETLKQHLDRHPDQARALRRWLSGAKGTTQPGTPGQNATNPGLTTDPETLARLRDILMPGDNGFPGIAPTMTTDRAGGSAAHDGQSLADRIDQLSDTGITDLPALLQRLADDLQQPPGLPALPAFLQAMMVRGTSAPTLTEGEIQQPPGDDTYASVLPAALADSESRIVTSLVQTGLTRAEAGRVAARLLARLAVATPALLPATARGSDRPDAGTHEGQTGPAPAAPPPPHQKATDSRQQPSRRLTLAPGTKDTETETDSPQATNAAQSADRPARQAPRATEQIPAQTSGYQPDAASRSPHQPDPKLTGFPALFLSPETDRIAALTQPGLNRDDLRAVFAADPVALHDTLTRMTTVQLVHLTHIMLPPAAGLLRDRIKQLARQAKTPVAALTEALTALLSDQPLDFEMLAQTEQPTAPQPTPDASGTGQADASAVFQSVRGARQQSAGPADRTPRPDHVSKTSTTGPADASQAQPSAPRPETGTTPQTDTPQPAATDPTRHHTVAESPGDPLAELLRATGLTAAETRRVLMAGHGGDAALAEASAATTAGDATTAQPASDTLAPTDPAEPSDAATARDTRADDPPSGRARRAQDESPRATAPQGDALHTETPGPDPSGAVSETGQPTKETTQNTTAAPQPPRAQEPADPAGQTAADDTGKHPARGAAPAARTSATDTAPDKGDPSRTTGPSDTADTRNTAPETADTGDSTAQQTTATPPEGDRARDDGQPPATSTAPASAQAADRPQSDDTGRPRSDAALLAHLKAVAEAAQPVADSTLTAALHLIDRLWPGRGPDDPPQAEFPLMRSLLANTTRPATPGQSLAARLGDLLPGLERDENRRILALRTVSARLGMMSAPDLTGLRAQTRNAIESLLRGDPSGPDATDTTRPAAPAPQQPPARPGPQSDSETLLVSETAGLVLLHPFYTLLFDRLELPRQGKKLDPGALPAARGILQNLAGTSGTIAPDPLHQVLLGVDPGAPLPEPTAPDTAACDLMDGLLRSVIDRWARLGATSPDGLREAFLRRTGTLRRDATGVHLRVTPGPFDMLLDSLPWSPGPVTLPWMPLPCHVHWREDEDE